MPDLTLAQLQEAIGGELVSADATCSVRAASGRIAIDSRQVQRGEVFWALAGRGQDGADFIPEAFRRGAAGVVTSRNIEPPPGRWVLKVHDSQQALQRLARWKRREFSGTVVGVTGSVGKTTTRSMIDTVLRRYGEGVASPRNYNNHVGLPLSMLALDRRHDYAVFELGASAAGEIGMLAELCRPDIGVITCIGEAHVGSFGSRETLAMAKCELLDRLPADGIAVLAGDDPWLRRLAQPAGNKILWVGRGSDCDLIADRIESRHGRLSLDVRGRRFEAPVWGRHHVTAMLAAIAVGRIVGLPDGEIADALAHFESPAMRCQVSQVRGVTVIDDSYNASPTAVRASLALLSEMETAGRRIVVAGDMRELGQAATQWHRCIGAEAITIGGADALVACGSYAEEMVAAARRAGMNPGRAIACRHVAEAAETVEQLIESGDVVLVKGSRALGMERVVERLQQPPRRLAA
jgi:UDP-N-acetylmuramoyl-tripeptide--D-alanyl-D-alanine ligase